jgi:hypothetical protein
MKTSMTNISIRGSKEIKEGDVKDLYISIYENQM